MTDGGDQGHERGRLQALSRYDILDTLPEERFERLTGLIADALDVPVVMINFIDQFRQWNKACVGLTAPNMPRVEAFCAWTIEHAAGMIVPDARLDPRFASHPLVTGEPHFVLYAGTPLTSPDGYRVGTLCVTDRVARPFGEREQRVLRGFGTLVEEALERRLQEHALRREVTLAQARAADLQRVTRHAETLAAITTLFDSGLDPVEATVACANLVGSAADVDWCGLFTLGDGPLDLIATWNRHPDGPLADLQVDELRSGLAAFATREQLSVYVDDYRADPHALPAILARGVTAASAQALGRIGDTSFMLASARTGPARPWSAADRTLLDTTARSVRGAVERHNLLATATAAAQLDALTGLPNRRALNEALDAAEAEGGEFQVALIDLDGMKTVNDTLGHERGDELLRRFSRALADQFPGTADVYRLGGDEFAVVPRAQRVLPESGLLACVAEAIRATRAAGFATVDASIGASVSGGRGAAAVLREADGRMYVHKRSKAAGLTAGRRRRGTAVTARR